MTMSIYRAAVWAAVAFLIGAGTCAVLAPASAKPAALPPAPEPAALVLPEKSRPVTNADAARYARGAAIDLGYRVVGIHCAGPVDGVEARCLVRLRDESGTEELVSWACGSGGSCWEVSAP